MGPAFFYSEVKLRELNDLNLRQVLTVTVGAVIALALLELEDEDLLALELLDDLGSDLLVLQGAASTMVCLPSFRRRTGSSTLSPGCASSFSTSRTVALGNLILPCHQLR